MTEPLNPGVVLVCGGRKFSNRVVILTAIDWLHEHQPILRLVAGAAPGADTLAMIWARKRHVEHKQYPADFVAHGRAAGPRRNRAMFNAELPERVIAFPGGVGTEDMIQVARESGAKIWMLDDTDWPYMLRCEDS